MNKSQLQQLVEAEVKKMIETLPSTDKDDISDTQSEMSPGSKLLLMPGAPSGGNNGTFAGYPMNNEKRQALKNWMRVAKKVMEKYPNPNEIPPDMTKMLELLGNKFNDKNNPPNNGVGLGNF